jgi:diguanylate cyclase (GGDEF)-like protein
MSSPERPFEDETTANVQDDLRKRAAAVLAERSDVISADSVAIFPYSGAESLDSDYCKRLSDTLVALLALAVRDAQIDARGNLVGDLRQSALERGISMNQLFTFAYLIERTALDELALHEGLGATSEPWPLVAQLVRRASFDLLAAYAELTQMEPTNAAIVDKLTTLYTRPLFEAVLSKEVERAGRFGYPIALIMFDVDRLSRINEDHGYGVGDKILERLGITLRKYFRQHDWVARYAEDAMAVLMTRTDVEHAVELAERARETIEERLGFTDHLTDKTVAVTVSAAVVTAELQRGTIIDAERLMADAEQALERAKTSGRNRVEVLVEPPSASRTLPHS